MRQDPSYQTVNKTEQESSWQWLWGQTDSEQGGKRWGEFSSDANAQGQGTHITPIYLLCVFC